MSKLTSDSLTVVFDPSSSYKLWSPSETKPIDWTARLQDCIGVHGRVWNPGPEDHPIHGKKGGKRVLYAWLQTNGGPNRQPNSEPVEVALKWVTGLQRIGLLRWEAGVYENQLKTLQGTTVPKFYGFFTAKIEGVHVGCLVLEWCGGRTHPNLYEANRQRMLAACSIHEKGILHGSLQDGHHFVPGSKDNVLRIVDFARAGVHACAGGTPLLINLSGEEQPRGCSELADLEETFGPDTGDQAHQIRMMHDLYPPPSPPSPSTMFSFLQL
ncbi:hypothetical protein AcW2_000199 [Taiwanofungus camphoratus]|nr:hypothetical protein AcW2_000199 [Antrodia cinnamomea]